MERYVERPFWRGDGAMSTSSMVEAICGYVKRFQALDGDARAWANGVYAEQQAMADFLFQVNHIEGEGFDSVEETRDAMQQLPEDAAQQLDERMEQVRCLRQAFRLWWLAEEEPPSLDNFRLRKSHDLLMASTQPAIAGLFRSSSELASTITSRGTQHFYTSPSSIRPKLANLVTRTNLQLQKIFASANKDWTSKTAIEQLLVLATDFFYKFECIHPFVDGNGRCGRIMLAYLLKSITVFPNVLFTASAPAHGYGFVDRNVYLKCFENAREVDDDEPQDLTALVIEGVYFGWQKFFDERARNSEGG